jgi:hypothetical protein
MLTILHYLPYFLVSGLVVLTLGVMFSEDDRKKRAFPERVRQQHYVWREDDVRSHKRF